MQVQIPDTSGKQRPRELQAGLMGAALGAPMAMLPPSIGSVMPLRRWGGLHSSLK